jgi:hypothetical protein
MLRLNNIFVLPFCLLLLVSVHATPKSQKRGLAYIGSKTSPTDDQIWSNSATDLTWYYNYGYRPTQSMTSSGYQYVPMLWGVPSAAGDFFNTVKSMKSGGQNITHVLGFNEPDGAKSTGGSAISAGDAANIWQKEMEPVKKLGVQIGAPATVGSGDGIKWLQSFLSQCSDCTIDFYPIHWYGPLDGLTGYINQMRQTFGNKTLWVTEFALPQASANDAEAFLNTSTSYLDQQSFVGRYAYFGGYRNDASNWVGSGAAMLTSKGQITSIGRLYLGNDVKSSMSTGPRPHKIWALFVGAVCVLLFK